jgi:hypothetical protein
MKDTMPTCCRLLDNIDGKQNKENVSTTNKPTWCASTYMGMSLKMHEM